MGMRPVKTRFRCGCVPEGLNLASEEQLVGSLCKRHAVTPYRTIARPRGSDWSSAHGFRYYFTRLLGVLFTFPSRYWFTIGHERVFSLAGWCRLLPTGFLRSRGTQEHRWASCLTSTGLSPSVVSLSREFVFDAWSRVRVLQPR